MDRQKVNNFLTNDLDEFGIIPKSKFVKVLSKDVNTNVDGVSRFDIRQFNAQIFNGNGMVVINESRSTQGKDVAKAQKRLRNDPGTEQRFFCLQRGIKSPGRDFQGCGVDLLVVVVVAFVVEYALGVIDIFDIFADAGTDQVILKPAVRPFDLAFGLR